MYRSFFDVDGVLLDFEGGFMKTIKDYFQLDIRDDFSSKSFGFLIADKGASYGRMGLFSP